MGEPQRLGRLAPDCDSSEPGNCLYIKQLGELIPPIKSGSTQIPLLAIGFLFGFSERLLDSIAEKTNQLWEKQEKTQSEKQQQPSG